MALNVDDLRPKKFKVTLKGHELESKPLRLSHALLLGKIGTVLESAIDYSTEAIRQAESDLDAVIAELIPELADVELDVTLTIELIQQLLGHVEPSDNKELVDKGVKFDKDPKVPRTG